MDIKTDVDIKIQDWIDFCQERIDGLSFEHTDYDVVLYPDGYVYRTASLSVFKNMLDDVRLKFKYLIGQISENGYKQELFESLLIMVIALSNAKRVEPEC